MSPEARKRSWVAVAVVVSIGYAILAHASLVSRVSPTTGTLLALTPVTLFAVWAVRRSKQRALGAAALALAAVMAWLNWVSLERHFPDIFFIEHATTNLLLAFVFGRTLAAGREPLVALFARLVHGTIPPEVERYARQVTLAWTVFFATLFTVSCALYFGKFLAAWSLLANILSPILITAMFVLEYAVRLRALPNWERVGIMGGIRAFSRHFGSARFEAPR